MAQRHRDPARLDGGDAPRRTARAGAAVNGSSGSSATAQWVHTAVERQARARRRRRSASATTSSGAAPTRCMPVSTLRWTGTRPPRPRPPRRAAAMQSRVYTVSADAGGQRARRARRAAARRAAGSAPSMPAAAQRRSPRRPARRPASAAPASSAARGHRHGAVAVAVGLDDRAHLGRRATARERRDVGRDRRRGDTSAHARAISRRTSAERARAGASTRSRRPPGPSARARARPPAVQPRAGGGRLERRDAAGEQGADDRR